jgi:hypothetical protein
MPEGQVDHDRCATIEGRPGCRADRLNDLGVHSIMAKGVSPAQSGSAEVKKLSPVARLKQMLEMEAELDGSQGSNFMDLAIEEMLLADTFEMTMELAASDAGIANGKTLVNKPIRVSAFQVVKSDAKYQDSSPLGYYLRITEAVYRKTGKDVQFATGAPKVVVPLWRARNENKLPLDCVVREREVGSGTMLFLELDDEASVIEEAPGY